MTRLPAPLVVASLLALSACHKADDTPRDAEIPAAVTTDAKAGDFSGDFNALGNEPFWAVRILATEITLERPDSPIEKGARPAPVVDGTTAKFTTVSSSGKALEVTLAASPCVDGMSGFTYPYTATVKTGDETLSGCATRPESGTDTDAE